MKHVELSPAAWIEVQNLGGGGVICKGLGYFFWSIPLLLKEVHIILQDYCFKPGVIVRRDTHGSIRRRVL